MASPSRRLITPPQPKRRQWRRFIIAAVLICSAVCLAIVLSHWPFSRRAATAALQHELGNPIRVGSFHATLFPLGYVAENISFVKNPKEHFAPDLTIRKLVVVASPLDLLLVNKRVERVLVSGVRFTLPDQSATHRKPSPPRFSEIGTLQFEDMVAQFPSSDSDPDPLTFTIKNFTFHEVSRSHSGSFEAGLSVNKPQGAIRLSGQIGPWDWNNIGGTPLSGSFALPRGDLAAFGGVRGSLNASGRFSGPLRNILCSGTVDSPDFQVSKSSHSVNLDTAFRASINGLNADVSLESAESHFNRTVIESKGSVREDEQRPGKVVSLRLTVEQGQVGDVLLLFTYAPQPSMSGTVDVGFNVEVPPGPPGFLKKLKVIGDFGIDRGSFTNVKAQQPINHLSESAAGMGPAARGRDRETVLSDVAGHISLSHGLATLSHISFAMPGAHGVISGTYDLLDRAVNLDGRLLTTGELSSTASGFTAMMLKVVSPFLTRHSVTTVPFTITGTAEHPKFSLNLLKKNHS